MDTKPPYVLTFTPSTIPLSISTLPPSNNTWFKVKGLIYCDNEIHPLAPESWESLHLDGAQYKSTLASLLEQTEESDESK